MPMDWVLTIVTIFSGALFMGIGFLIKSAVARISDLEISDSQNKQSIAVHNSELETVRERHSNHDSDMKTLVQQVNHVDKSLASLSASFTQMNISLTQFMQNQFKQHG